MGPCPKRAELRLYHGSTTMAKACDRRYSMGTGAPYFAGCKENESTIWDQTSRYTPGRSFTENRGSGERRSNVNEKLSPHSRQSRIGEVAGHDANHHRRIARTRIGAHDGHSFRRMSLKPGDRHPGGRNAIAPRSHEAAIIFRHRWPARTVAARNSTLHRDQHRHQRAERPHGCLSLRYLDGRRLNARDLHTSVGDGC